MKFLFWMKKIVGEGCTWSTIEPDTHDIASFPYLGVSYVCMKHVGG